MRKLLVRDSAGSVRSGIAGTLALSATAVLTLFGVVGGLSSAYAGQSQVDLGKASSFAVLAAQTVTNTGKSVISGNVGVSPLTAITGFPPGTVIRGTKHSADVLAGQAQSALTTAYTKVAGLPATTVSKELGGKTLGPGVYTASKAGKELALTGTLTLNAHGKIGAVFIFKAGSTLITASSSTVDLINGAQACNVFWQVGSSATLGTGTTFVGSILALTSATIDHRASVQGRVLARNGQVSLNDNVITRPACKTTSPTTTTTSGGGTTTTTSGGGTTTTVGGGTTTTVGGGTTTTVPGTIVPPTHTGEPWAGWPYWALTGLLGLGGLVAIERAVQVRRRRS